MPTGRPLGGTVSVDRSVGLTPARGQLDLRHGWPTFPDTTTSEVDSAAASTEEREEQTGSERGKAEPEKGGGRLSLLAAVFGVMGAVGDRVAVGVGTVATAVYVKLGCHRNGGAEPEEHVEHVQGEWKHRVKGKVVVKGDEDEVEQRQHAEDGHEHIVVDDGGVAGEGGSNHVADQSHDNQSAEELEGPQAEIEDSGHHVDGER